MVEKNNQEISSKNVQEISYHLSANLEEYLERFEQIEKGKNRFNFSAAFFQNLWLAYQFMFLDWFFISLIGFFLNLFLSIWLQFQTGSVVDAILRSMWIFFFFWIIKFMLLGRFGDRLLYRSIKKRIMNSRKGKVNLITRMTASDKTVVFRGVAVIASEISLLILSDNVLTVLIDWLLY